MFLPSGQPAIISKSDPSRVTFVVTVAIVHARMMIGGEKFALMIRMTNGRVQDRMPGLVHTMMNMRRNSIENHTFSCQSFYTMLSL